MTNSATIAARYTPSVLRLRCYSPRLLTTGSQEAPAGSLLTCTFRISPRMRLPPLGEISFSQQGKALRASIPQRSVLQPHTAHLHKEGKVTSTGHSSDQYWSQREVVLVDICYQYWSRRRPVLVRIPPPLLAVTAFRYSYICDRRRLRHHPTTAR